MCLCWRRMIQGNSQCLFWSMYAVDCSRLKLIQRVSSLLYNTCTVLWRKTEIVNDFQVATLKFPTLKAKFYDQDTEKEQEMAQIFNVLITRWLGETFDSCTIYWSIKKKGFMARRKYLGVFVMLLFASSSRLQKRLSSSCVPVNSVIQPELCVFNFNVWWGVDHRESRVD